MKIQENTNIIQNEINERKQLRNILLSRLLENDLKIKELEEKK